MHRPCCFIYFRLFREYAQHSLWRLLSRISSTAQHLKNSLVPCFSVLVNDKHISGSAGHVQPSLYQSLHISVHQTCIRMEKKHPEMSSLSLSPGPSILTHRDGTSCPSRENIHIQSSRPPPVGLSQPSVTSGAAQPCHSLHSPLHIHHLFL